MSIYVMYTIYYRHLYYIIPIYYRLYITLYSYILYLYDEFLLVTELRADQFKLKLTLIALQRSWMARRLAGAMGPHQRWLGGNMLGIIDVYPAW